MITVAGLRRGGLVVSPALHCLLPSEKRLAPLTAARIPARASRVRLRLICSAFSWSIAAGSAASSSRRRVARTERTATGAAAPVDANQAGQRFGRPEAVMNAQPREVRGEPRVVGGDQEVGDQRRLAEPRPSGALRTRLAGTVRGSGRAPSPSGRLTPSCAAPQAPRFRFP
jgi:hypothetical protein